MTPQDFFVVFGVSPYAVIAYVLLHLHIVAIGRRVSRLESRRTPTPERKSMDAVKVERLAALQKIPPADLHPIEAFELEQLRRELAQRPEVADDPNTLLVDEAQRPNIEGDDDAIRDRDAATRTRETVDDVRAFVRFARWVVGLFRGGR